MQTSSSPPPSRGAGWNPWPISIIAFFTVAVIGCVTFVVFCSRHPADLVASDYYEQEVRYQNQMDRVNRARERAQLTSVAYDSTRQIIAITLPPEQAGAKTTGNIQLYRPSAADQDRHIQFQPNAAGVQTIDARQLRPGLWQVRVSWTADNQDYYIDQKVVVISGAS